MAPSKLDGLVFHLFKAPAPSSSDAEAKAPAAARLMLTTDGPTKTAAFAKSTYYLANQVSYEGALDPGAYVAILMQQNPATAATFTFSVDPSAGTYAC